ncbi:MFS transporter [Hymenobacter sp. RP-2-7]|uniref:MFS transporter n=1 Tax=Hymenobacter polaris TaxID=2682546 RepID=A0A7Y0FNR3_9BACT|nr:MFS transporter [Hymenobacter polaris]NML67242.1 MFS transporter [Hymenobacter polaris]
MAHLVLRDSARLRYFTFFYLYVMQGIPAGFGLTATYNYLIGQGLTAKAVGSFAAIVGLPWTFQFVWGPLIDKYQYSVIGHRKQWVVLTQLVAALASLSLLLVRDPVAQVGLLGGVFFVHSVFASIQDASVDAIAISVVPLAERGRVNAFMRGGFLLGSAVGGAVLAYVLHHGGFRWAAVAQTAALLVFTVLTFFIKLDRTDQLLPRLGRARRPAAQRTPTDDALAHPDENPSLGWLFRELWRSMVERHSLRAFLIIFLAYLAGYLFSNAFNFHLIHALRWSDTDVSILQGSWGSLVSFAVLLGGGVLVDRIGPPRLQYWVMVGLGVFLLVFSSLAAFWVSRPVAFSGLVVLNLADPLLSVAAMPLLMAFCRPRIEGSQFTTYMALVNLCGVTASYLNGWLLEITTAPIIGFGAGLLLTGLLLALHLLNPNAKAQTQAQLAGVRAS